METLRRTVGRGNLRNIRSTIFHPQLFLYFRLILFSKWRIYAGRDVPRGGRWSDARPSRGREVSGGEWMVLFFRCASLEPLFCFFPPSPPPRCRPFASMIVTRALHASALLLAEGRAVPLRTRATFLCSLAGSPILIESSLRSADSDERGNDMGMV